MVILNFFAGTYEAARLHVKQAENHSELSSEGTTPPQSRRRKPSNIKTIKCEFDGSSSDNENEGIPALPKFPRLELLGDDSLPPVSMRRNEKIQQICEDRRITDTSGGILRLPSLSLPNSVENRGVTFNSHFAPGHPNWTVEALTAPLPLMKNVIFSDSTNGFTGPPTSFEFPGCSTADTGGWCDQRYQSFAELSPSVSHQREVRCSTYVQQMENPFTNDHHDGSQLRSQETVTENPSTVNITPPLQRNHDQSENSVDKSGIDFQNWMIRNVAIIKAQIKQLQESVDVLLTCGGPQSTAAEAVPISNLAKIPIYSVSELEGLNAVLLEDTNRQRMIKHLALHGGKDVADCTRRILSALMSDQVAERFSWLGSRGDKMSFKNSFLKPLLYDSVRQCNLGSNATDSQMEIVIKEWLKNAKKRLIPPEKQ
ncbi:unnamed protein product [Orchesella dallaii]|uniref:DUF4806 domain-containing protein n=1 Tax=Orchesella dallaii TaxID=48710 RepID=A0ABP1QRC1_9HEXA